MGNHWIVLINRSPRGPLTFEEVSTLLKDNVIKRTDLALQISLENKESKSDWKFLWQYSEFDLRDKNDSAESSPKNKTLEYNRRSPSNENKLKAEISAILPDEIAMINPEDLVISNQRNRIREGSSPLILGDEGIREDIPSAPKAEGSGWRYLGLGSFMMLLAVFYWKGSGYREPSEVETSSLSERSISKDSTVIPAKTNPSVGKESSLSLNDSTKKQSLELNRVKPPGRNEISLEDYQKLKEERAGKERLEEEDQRRENEEAAMVAKEEEEQEETVVANSEREDNEEVTELPLKKSKKTKRSSRVSRSQKRKLAEESEEGSDRERATDRERSTDSLEKENDSKDNNEERNEP